MTKKPETLADKTIQALLAVLHKAMDAEERRHFRATAALNHRLVVIQRRCAHSKTNYYPDPSGNNDSTTTCVVCGKEV